MKKTFRKPSTDIALLRNLGPVSAGWLRTVGITTCEELKRVGSGEAYRRVMMHGFRPTPNLLFAMEAGLRNIHWTALSPRLKDDLRREVQWLGKSSLAPPRGRR